MKWLICILAGLSVAVGSSFIGFADKGLHHGVVVGLAALGIVIVATGACLCVYLLDHWEDL